MRRPLALLGLSLAMGLATAFGFPATTAKAAEVVARVDLSSQQMTVYVDGRPRYDWDVSTARKGYRTPVGSYRPTRMHKMWYSRKYDMAPMPNSVFFHGGYAIHGTPHVRALGRPASHGCIRLAPANARTLYRLIAQRGMKNARVVITR
jgi:lipoprotein-anchoring transpeptidase ErfK/SrfK